LQRVAVCCSVSQCVVVCCSVLQCVAVCCSVLQCVSVCCSVLRILHLAGLFRKWCCSVLHVLQCVAVCCSVLQCVAVWCSVLQCVAICACTLVCMHVCICACTNVWVRRSTSTLTNTWHPCLCVSAHTNTHLAHDLHDRCSQMSHVPPNWMSHVTHMKESHTYTSHAKYSLHTLFSVQFVLCSEQKLFSTQSRLGSLYFVRNTHHQHSPHACAQ